MAFDSASRRPSSSTTAGMRPKGKRARNSGVLLSPFVMSMGTQVYGRPRWSAVYFTLRQLPEPRSPKIFIARALPACAPRGARSLTWRLQTGAPTASLSLVCPETDLDHVQPRRVGGLLPGDLHQGLAVFHRHHLLELGQIVGPAIEDGARPRRVGV